MNDDLILDQTSTPGTPDDTTAAETVTADVPCADLGGVAGSGKTFEIVRRCREDDGYGMLCSTTGISAINLGATTVNALLAYFDTESCRDAYLSGQLTRRLHDVGLNHRWLIIDEKSMLDAAQLDYIYRATEEANRYADMTKRPLGLMLSGDFCQLPPVKARWCFEADCWPRFAANSVTLTKVWRQDGGLFLDGLNAARAGDGVRAAGLLTDAGVVWHNALATEFDGTTILPKNDMVARYNALALARVKSPTIRVTSRRWGTQRPEWGESKRTHEWGIPPTAEFKVGAYVMLLANESDGAGGFSYVNGDCGHIVDGSAGSFDVQLVRTGAVVTVFKIARSVETADEPSSWDGAAKSDGTFYSPRVHRSTRRRRWIVGQVEYMPMRLAWASTVHKSQGLTLDRCQIDIRDSFFGMPAMAYVALSRCRTAAGLRIVGQAERFVKQVKIDERVRRWL